MVCFRAIASIDILTDQEGREGRATYIGTQTHAVAHDLRCE